MSSAGTQVERHLPAADSSAVRTKLEMLLSAAASGVSANSSATSQDILVFVHGVLTAAADGAAEAQRQSGDMAGRLTGFIIG